MIIRIKLFAVARQLANADAISVELPEGATVAQLRAQVGAQYPTLESVFRRSMLALNAEYAQDHAVVAHDAAVACIPPVSGG